MKPNIATSIFIILVLAVIAMGEGLPPPSTIWPSEQPVPSVQRFIVYQIGAGDHQNPTGRPTILVDTQTGVTWALRIIDRDEAKNHVEWGWVEMKVLYADGGALDALVAAKKKVDSLGDKAPAGKKQ